MNISATISLPCLYGILPALLQLGGQNLDAFLDWIRSFRRQAPLQRLSWQLPALALASILFGAALAHVLPTMLSSGGHVVSRPVTMTVRSPENPVAFSAESAAAPGSVSQKLSFDEQRAILRKQARLEWGEEAFAESTRDTYVKYAQDYRSRGIINFAEGKVTIETIDGSLPVEHLREAVANALSAPLESGGVSLLAGELLAADALWRTDDLAQKLVRECSIAREVSVGGVRRVIHSISLPMLSGSSAVRADKYRPLADRYARQYNLTPALLLAVMQAESNFNPFAVSPNNALGLMQVVPETAGNEVHKYLTGEPGEPSVETLLTPEQNIRYGAVYLHLLARRYFSDVLNPASREMCVIAAYNGGPGAVLRAFDPDQDVAVARINLLSPEELYDSLTTRMPTPETRRYVATVLGHMRSYTR